MDNWEVKTLKKYGAKDIKGYCLVSNYGYTFTIDDAKYDIRFWANCYGSSPNKWCIHPCTKDDSGNYINLDRKLITKIENAFNKQAYTEA